MITAEPWALAKASEESLIKPEVAIKFLQETSKYFRIQADRSNEDITIHSYSANAETCDRIIELLQLRLLEKI